MNLLTEMKEAAFASKVAQHDLERIECLMAVVASTGYWAVRAAYAYKNILGVWKVEAGELRTRHAEIKINNDCVSIANAGEQPVAELNEVVDILNNKLFGDKNE